MSSTATKTVRSEDGTTIAYDRVGAGPAVAVVGGGPTDRLANAPLAALLADRLTVYSYDRRGRRESGGAEACALERECEDLGAVIATAGGVAAAFGTSSGAVLTLEAASRGVPLSSLVLWEPSYVVDDSRTPPPAGLADSVAELVAAGRNGDALELFFTGAVDMRAEAVALMRSQPFWEGMEATAPALVHDITFMGDFSQPADRLGSVSAPTLVVDGGTTPWLTASADAVAAAVPGAVRQTIAGQPHNVDPFAIAPVIANGSRMLRPPPAGVTARARPRMPKRRPGGRPLLNEKQRRVVAGAMAVALGRGGQVRVEATGRLSTRRLGQATLPRQTGQLDRMCV